MAREMLPNLASSSARLSLRLRALCYWGLVYTCCLLCAAAALLKLCWSLALRPTATLRWEVRDSPPACLHDTSLGTHCYVRIKVRHVHVLGSR